MKRQITRSGLTRKNKKLTLIESLKLAIKTCYDDRDDYEEAGGVILVKKDKYEFISLRNTNTGTPIAPSLWTADRMEYSKQVYPKLFDKKGKWIQHGSFHTHPRFSAQCSGEDLDKVFKAYPVNYIFSGLNRQLLKYEWTNEQTLLISEILWNKS